jgi:hypothetical protein
MQDKFRAKKNRTSALKQTIAPLARPLQKPAATLLIFLFYKRHELKIKKNNDFSKKGINGMLKWKPGPKRVTMLISAVHRNTKKKPGKTFLYVSMINLFFLIQRNTKVVIYIIIDRKYLNAFIYHLLSVIIFSYLYIQPHSNFNQSI